MVVLFHEFHKCLVREPEKSVVKIKVLDQSECFLIVDVMIFEKLRETGESNFKKTLKCGVEISAHSSFNSEGVR